MAAETFPSTTFSLTPEEQQWMDSHAEDFSCGTFFSHTAQVQQAETLLTHWPSASRPEREAWELIGSDAVRVHPEHGYTL